MVNFKIYATILATNILPAVAQQAILNSSQDNNSQWTTFPHSITRVAVIGAGPNRLQAAAHLLAANLTVRLYERAQSPGGNWFYAEDTPVREAYPSTTPNPPDAIPDEYPTTRYYEEGEDGLSLKKRWKEHWQPRPVWYNLHTNGSGIDATITQVPGVGYPPDTPWSVSVHDVQRHVRAYASLHGLNANDKPFAPPYGQVSSYSTRVEGMKKCNETATWTLTLRQLQWLPESKRLKAEYWTETFDAVVVATGHYTTAHIPDIKGIGNWSAAMEDGHHSVYHSNYRHPERYSGKASLFRLFYSARRPNKYRDAHGLDILFGFPGKAEIVPEIASFGPLSENAIGIKNGEVMLVNGTVLSGIDEVQVFICALSELRLLAEKDLPLHWTGHYLHDPTLAYTSVRPWTDGRYQNYPVAKVWTAVARLPSSEQMWRDYRSKKYLPAVSNSSGLSRLYVAWLTSESLKLGG
ncbi:FAD/NAD-P-binding domain-containing protein [Mycena alexandri]|uniref:FAD/NAD-P-binding domain-containing protein n=1 Tax=Mycena alexandri TaxID=1745969 RepID=A0AAD6XEF4_9AGAR|nr:FAD/NAD-P-binding domain-containing protein [Mycena alexandri]